MSSTCNFTVMFALALVCVPIGMALTGINKPGEAFGAAIGADGIIQQKPHGDEGSSSFVDDGSSTTCRRRSCRRRKSSSPPAPAPLPDGFKEGDDANIRFGGEQTGTTAYSSENLFVRPASIKSDVCDKEACHGCTDMEKCWHGTEGPGKNQGMVLDEAKRDQTSYVAEVYLRCPTGGRTVIKPWQLEGGEIEIYTDQETPGHMKAVFERSADKKDIKITESANRDIRVRMIFYPDDASEDSEVILVFTAENVDPQVDGCMTGKECLGLLEDGEDTKEGFDLRNDNKLQLDCLEGRTMATDKLQNKCGKWDNCVSKPPGGPGHKIKLIAFLRAGVGNNGGSLNQGAVVANGTAAAATDPNKCVDPAADDAESWDCECLDDMVRACEVKFPDSPLDECLRARMCNFDAICPHWKTDNGCPNLLIEQKSTDASAKLMRRQVSSKSRADIAINSELDGTMQGKCSQ